MTVIAWDGNILAADRLNMSGDTLSTSVKIEELPDGRVMAIVGRTGNGLALMRWYREGGDAEKWPAFQEDKDRWVRLIVAFPDGLCVEYEQVCEPMPVYDSFMAWGCGKEAALGAMEMGATAIRAIEVASKWISGCGRGLDYRVVKNPYRCAKEVIDAKKKC